MKTRIVGLRWVPLASAAVALAFSAGCAPKGAASDGVANSRNASATHPRTPMMLGQLGDYRRPVNISESARPWFDQGLLLLYGFNHEEAIRSFERAAELDPDCAMAWWGIAYANGPHINRVQVESKNAEAAWHASNEAMSRIAQARPEDAAIIRATSTRSAWPEPEDRTPLERANADAMSAVWASYPNDPDVGALYAEALMNLQPWDLWNKDGSPKGVTPEVIDVLEEVLVMRPDHPGANHFYIHTVEASPDPGRALPAANRLRTLVPASGHLVHMPSHIDVRTGRYGEAVVANERAVAADRAYVAKSEPADYYGLYIAHNLDMLAFAAMMDGQSKKALDAATRLEREIPSRFLEDYLFLADGFLDAKTHVLIRFGQWEALVNAPAPPANRKFSRAFWHYGRATGFAWLGRVDEARAELARFDEAAAEVPADWFAGNNPASAILAIAHDMLEGEIAFRAGDREAAFAHLRDAVRKQDELIYDEPPGWMQPARHALGALLLCDGRGDEAVAVFRADLARNPGNGWALLGLEQGLRLTNRDAEANAVAAERRTAFARADVKPEAACYCAVAGGM